MHQKNTHYSSTKVKKNYKYYQNTLNSKNKILIKNYNNITLNYKCSLLLPIFIIYLKYGKKFWFKIIIYAINIVLQKYILCFSLIDIVKRYIRWKFSFVNIAFDGSLLKNLLLKGTFEVTPPINKNISPRNQKLAVIFKTIEGQMETFYPYLHEEYEPEKDEETLNVINKG